MSKEIKQSIGSKFMNTPHLQDMVGNYLVSTVLQSMGTWELMVFDRTPAPEIKASFCGNANRSARMNLEEKRVRPLFWCDFEDEGRAKRGHVKMISMLEQLISN